MKKNIKRIFAWMLMFAVLVSGANVVNKTAPKKVEAAETKCYGFCEDGDYIYSTKKRVKIGKYYYRVNKYGNLQRSKSKNKNFKTILKSNTTDYLIYGNLIYFAQLSGGKKGEMEYTIYNCNMNGESQKKIFTTQKQASRLSFSTIYKNKLYLSIYGESEGDCQTYSISLKGKAKLKKVKNKLCLFNQRYGQYILGADWLPSDVGDHGVCIYDVKKNKKINLGTGRACFAGKKVYYSSYSAKAECYYIKRCNPDGSNKEVIVQLDKEISLVTKVTKTYCEGITMSNDGKEKKKVIKY